VECDLCDSTGFVIVKGKDVEYICPQCFGDKQYKKLGKEMTICKTGKIGKICVEQYDSQYKNTSGTKYMIDKTGVGSGTVWREEELFASEEEAQRACDEFNKNNLL
jgi:predicted RNA-binding Zn-ribbon protein involved in translation (DUF1610 family)